MPSPGSRPGGGTRRALPHQVAQAEAVAAFRNAEGKPDPASRRKPAPDLPPHHALGPDRLSALPRIRPCPDGPRKPALSRFSQRSYDFNR